MLRKYWVARLCWAALLLWMMLPSASAAPRDAVTTRIVSLVPNMTELAFAVGAGDQIAGVSDFCFYPKAAQSRPRVGGLINPNLEAILRLHPHAVILYRSQTDFAGRLKSLGLAPSLFRADTLNDLYEALEALGPITGRTTAAVQLAQDIKSRLDEIKTSATAVGQGPKPRGIVIVSRDPADLRSLYQADASRFLGELFLLAGGELAIPHGAPVTVEQIIRSNPDIILDMSYAGSAPPNAEASAPEKHTGPWAKLNTVNAVKTGQVYRWSDPHRLLLGTTVPDTASKIQAVIKDARTAN